MLTGAKEDILGLWCFPFDGSEVGALVRSIAEGLIGRLASGTPEIGFTFFNTCADR